MKKSTTVKCRSLLIVLFIFIIFSTAFIVNKNGMSGPGDPVKLVYNFVEGKSISYASSTSINQSMDINGQTMNTFINNDLGFKVKLTGKAGEHLQLEITIDSLSMKVESPNGSSGSKIKDVEGKSFNILLSPLGKVVDLSEAEKIEYTIEGSGSTNLSLAFVGIFPQLPANPVKQGDTWSKNDTIIKKSGMTKITQIYKSDNKFEGIENISGIDCARITSAITGTMEASTQNMGMDIFYSGPLQGTVTLYFAIKEGYFVSQETQTKMTGTIEISGPQSMSFPLVMDTKNKIGIKK